MGSYRFWATISLAIILSLLGFTLASTLPIPGPFTPTQVKALYALVGFLIGLLTFARIAQWVISTTTNLIRQTMFWVVREVTKQITQGLAKASPQWFGGTASLDIASMSDLGKGKAHYSGAIIVDTSSLIDGRLLDVAKSGFLLDLLILPDFVLRELQQVADSADPIKRSRGRRGFEIINEMKKNKNLKLQVWDEVKSYKKIRITKKQLEQIMKKSVDDRLIALAKILNAKVLTCDFNLNRVADLEGVKVLNINELSNALKFLPVPGEKIQTRIQHLGKDKNQGIGYLVDGTMVVVKNGFTKVGQEVEVEVTKILQTPAGRMIFARI